MLPAGLRTPLGRSGDSISSQLCPENSFRSVLIYMKKSSFTLQMSRTGETPRGRRVCNIWSFISDQEAKKGYPCNGATLITHVELELVVERARRRPSDGNQKFNSHNRMVGVASLHAALTASARDCSRVSSLHYLGSRTVAA